MKMKLSISFVLLLTLVAAVFAADGQKDVPKYEVINHFAVGGEGGWDYLAFDDVAGRLFISRGTHVLVLDPSNGKQLGDIPDTPGVHGIALAQDLGLGFISNGRAGTVTIFDLKTLKKTGDVKAGTNPDAILYDRSSQRVFAFNGRSSDATVIDAAKASVLATIPLGGKPEFAASDEKGHVFVNIEDKSELVELDAQKMTVLARWPLTGCEEPSGLAIDREKQRLFSVCDNKTMAVTDATNGKVVATVPIGQGPDAAAYDPAIHTAFSSNGEGSLTVVQQESADKYAVAQTVTTARGARTMALDSKTHTIYLVTAKFGPAPEPTKDQPHPRPIMEPGSFEVIVVGQK